VSSGFQSTGRVAKKLAVTLEEMLKRWRTREVSWIVGVKLLPPIRRMGPDEIIGIHGRKIVWITGIETFVNVRLHTGDSKFLANVGTSA
jgi:hypothetical protein